MIKKRSGQHHLSNDNFCHIRIKKSVNNDKNTNMISPELSHQENNYFYNTKINRLILQELPKNSIQNIYQQPTQINKSLSLGYDLLQGQVNDLFYTKKNNDNIFNENSSFKNLPMDIKNFKQNSQNDFFYNKEISRDDYINANNNSNNINNIFYNNDNDYLKDDEVCSTSLRLSNNPKQVIISKIIKNKNYLKDPRVPELSSNNNYNNNLKSNIKNKFASSKMTLNPDKENNEFKNILFRSGQEFYKKENDININIKNNMNKISRDKKISPNNYIYFKNNPKNIQSIEITKRNNKSKGNIIQKKIKNYKVYDNNLLFKKIEKFCEIMEEVYFISFKSSYSYFIQNLKFFIKNRNKSKALILRRFEDVKKSKHKKANNSMIDIEVKNNEKYKTFIDNNSNGKNMIRNYNNINKSQSPSKFIELNNKNNKTNSMTKINNEKYNGMFNNYLKKGNDENQIFRSTLFDEDNTKNLTKNIEKNKVYNKYIANTKNNILFQKNKNNKTNQLKTSSELESKNKYNNNINLNTNKYNELLSDQENYTNKSSKINEHNKKNLKTRNNSCLDINNSERKFEEQIKLSIDNHKTDLLYSKPIYKKSIDNSINKDKSIRINININERIKKYNLKSNIFKKNNRSFNYQKNELNKDNYNEIKEKIITNLKSKDKKLSVLIKYISFKNDNKNIKRKNYNKNDFFAIHTDSLFIIAHVNNKYEKDSKNEKIHRTKYKHNNFILNRYGEYLNELNINYSSKNMDKKNYNNIFITNEKNENVIQYLISLLQNIYNDNIKQTLFIFFKNIRKIKRNSLYSSMQFEKRNNFGIFNKKVYYNHLKKNNILTESSNKKNNKKEGNENFNLGENIQDLSNESKTINNDCFFTNKSRNQLDINNNIKFDNILNRKRNIKTYETNNNENDKDLIEKKKLAKLGKLFNHLNKENNIINTIKEQFLNWTNKNEIQNNSRLKNDNDDEIQNSIKYKVKTFDKVNRNDKKTIEKREKEKINKFRYKLISFSLKNFHRSKI